MPCYDDRNTYGYGFQEGVKELHNSPLAEIMCGLCTAMNLNNLRVTDYSTKAGEWWEEHQVRDAKKKAEESAAIDKERQRLEALAKLTKAEKRILGIKE